MLRILWNLHINKELFEELSPTFFWNDTDNTEKEAPNTVSIALYVFIAAVTFLQSSYLPTTERFMEYTTKIGSGAMIYTPSFIKISSGIQKLVGKCTDTQTEIWSNEPNSIFFQNK
jgi:hypothetical protein